MQIGADAVGDLAKALEIPGPRIGRAAGDDQLWLHFLGAAGDLVHVDDLVVAAHGVVLRLEPFAGNVDGRAVGEMAAGGEIEAHEGVAGLQQRQKHRLVHLAAGVRLHIGKLRAEQFFGALDRQRLGDVDPFAAAVIAVARITFRVFVGHHRALRFQHRAADDVFGSDQLDLMALPAEFALDGGGDLGIGLGKRGGEERSWARRRFGRWSEGVIGEISPPPQAFKGQCGRSWVAVGRCACARYHIAPEWPSGCGRGPVFMQDMVGMAGELRGDRCSRYLPRGEGGGPIGVVPGATPGGTRQLTSRTGTPRPSRPSV